MVMISTIIPREALTRLQPCLLRGDDALLAICCCERYLGSHVVNPWLVALTKHEEGEGKRERKSFDGISSGVLDGQEKLELRWKLLLRVQPV